ncbi:MAG: hypothetical protein GX300_03525 [Tissierellia bacterium]|nr:hypothetical protein [Tissierellia bacterium]
MKKNNILIIFILIGIIASSILAINRVRIEGDNKTVDITLDYNDIIKFAEQTEEGLSWWLKKFKDLGVNSVTINEDTFESMMEDQKPLEVKMVGNIIREIGWRDKYPQPLVNYIDESGRDKYDLVVVTDSESLFQLLKVRMDERYDENKYKLFNTENQFIIILDGTEKEALYSKTTLIDENNKFYSDLRELTGSKLMRLGLGFDKDTIEIIKDSGLEVVLRPCNNNPNWIDEKYIKAYFKEHEKHNIVPKYMIFSSNEIIGYPDKTGVLREHLLANKMKVVLIETEVQRGVIEQEGIIGLTKDLNYEAIRLFSMVPYIQERYKFYNYEGAEEIENTLYRAVTERNIRLIFFRPFKENKTDYVTDYQEYERTFNSFKERIAEHNMSLGDASTMRYNQVSLIYKILIGFGLFGGGMLLLGIIFKINERLNKILIILGALLCIITPYVIPNMSEILYSLAAAIIFPSLSMAYFCKLMKSYSLENKVWKLKEIIFIGVKTLLIMVLITSIGALFVASLLSGIDYLLEIDIFRGVKFAQLIPIFLYLVVFLVYFGFRREKTTENEIKISEVKDILYLNIKVITVIVGIVALAVGYIYIARTGHETNIQPSNLEMIARNFLELKLLARPRTKEFLLAFPAVILAAYMIRYKSNLAIFVLGIIITIGQTSIVNTFCHLRTPLYLSIIRTFYGVLFGVLLGIIYTGLLVLVTKISKKMRGELLNE